MDVNGILGRFRSADGDSWRQVALRIGVPYRRMIGWRGRNKIPSCGIQMLIRRARELGVGLSPADFFDGDSTSEAA